MRTLRWGILSTADIARKNWKAIRNSGNGTVTAVASRDLKKAQQFILECQTATAMDQTPAAFGSYEELLSSPNVDAVYIPLPTGLRKEWVIRAAEAGKHIVCEKPCAPSAQELRSMLDVCRRKGVQFLDGVMFMHSERLAKVRREIASGVIGKVKRISSAFSFPSDDNFRATNIRTDSSLEPFGCLGDLGWYCIRLALCVADGALPREVSGRILKEVRGSGSPAAVPEEFSGELFFEDGISSSFYCSFASALEEWGIITGTKGLIRVQDFVLPFWGSELAFDVFNADLKKSGCDFNMEANERRITVAEYSNSHPTAQETNLFRNFAAQVQSGPLNHEWAEIALRTQQVTDACLKSARCGSALVPV